MVRPCNDQIGSQFQGLFDDVFNARIVKLLQADIDSTCPQRVGQLLKPGQICLDFFCRRFLWYRQRCHPRINGRRLRRNAMQDCHMALERLRENLDLLEDVQGNVREIYEANNRLHFNRK